MAKLGIVTGKSTENVILLEPASIGQAPKEEERMVSGTWHLINCVAVVLYSLLIYQDDFPNGKTNNLEKENAPENSPSDGLGQSPKKLTSLNNDLILLDWMCNNKMWSLV